MKLNKSALVCLALLVTAAASAQVPCNPTTLPTATSSVNWPLFHYDVAHTGCNPYESILSPSTVGKLVLDWKYTTGAEVESAPVVANGIVYVGSNDNNLYALNAATGELIWKYDTGDDVAYAPAVANGMVYISFTENWYTKYLVALDARTGALIWKLPTSGVSCSTPTIADGVVYASAGLNLYALDAVAGSLLWQNQHGDSGPPTVVNGTLYTGSDNYAYALSASTGTVLWTYRTGDLINDSPTVASGVVYFGSRDYLTRALDADAGTLLWELNTGPIYCSGVSACGPAFADGVLYVEGGFPDLSVYALDGKTGRILWQHYGVGGRSSPTVANGVLYFGADDYNIYALNARTGAILWDYPTTGYVTSAPAVVNGRVYIGSHEGNVYAFHLPGH